MIDIHLSLHKIIFNMNYKMNTYLIIVYVIILIFFI